jgi:hypothetical protein
MVAAISLTFRGKKSNTRTTDPVVQMRATSASRLRLVNPKIQHPMDLSPPKEGDAS